MKTIEVALTELQHACEDMHAAKTERIGSPSLGDVVRQGDIYLVCIDKCNGTPTKDMQLAPGNTQGSRHILQGNVQVYNECTYQSVDKVLVGPSFQCVGETTVTHPEHGDKVLPEDTCWQVIYQQAFADEVRRVRD